MRRILIEQARKKASVKHGGGRRLVSLEESGIATREDRVDLDDLEQLGCALDRLEQEDATKATLVKLRHFVGMTIPQAAEALGISRATAERYWTYSRVRLYELMTGAARETRT